MHLGVDCARACSEKSFRASLSVVLFQFQYTSDNNGYADISHQSNNNDTDDLHDDDILTPADLMTFAWQIAKGMVRAVFIMLKLML